MIVESGYSEFVVDLRKAYGNKRLQFPLKETEIIPFYKALLHIYNEPNEYVLFELCGEKEGIETLSDIAEILEAFKGLLEKFPDSN